VQARYSWGRIESREAVDTLGKRVKGESLAKSGADNLRGARGVPDPQGVDAREFYIYVDYYKYYTYL